jgi:hypothetical protein
MARGVDLITTSSPAEGFNMVTVARTSHAHPALSSGVYPTAVADPNAPVTPPAAGSPGACLGTGMNVDIYTPALET